MTDKRQKATKVKCKRDESLTKQSIVVEYSLLYNKHLSFAGGRSQMNTTLYQNHITFRLLHGCSCVCNTNNLPVASYM